MKINTLSFVLVLLLMYNETSCQDHYPQDNLTLYRCEAPYSTPYDNYYCYSFRNTTDSSMMYVYSYKDSCVSLNKYDSVHVGKEYSLNIRKADKNEEVYILSTLSISNIPFATDQNKAGGLRAIYINKSDVFPIYVCNDLCGMYCMIKRE